MTPASRLLCFLLAVGCVHAAKPLPVADLIQHPAHFFDLQHKAVTFRPGQPVRVRASRGLLARGQPVAFGRTRLPFAFPFAGHTWTEVFINHTGCLTFVERDGEARYLVTWPDGTMRTRAATADLAAMRGQSFMIAPLWGLNDHDKSRAWLAVSRREAVVTWDVVRYFTPFEGYEPLGRSVFQVRLRANGEVEFRYAEAAEKDSFTGLFAGLPKRETKLADQVFDAGSLLHFAVPERDRRARAIVVTGSVGTLMQAGHEGPATAGIIFEGPNGHGTDAITATHSRLESGVAHFYLPKLALLTPDRFRWNDGDSASTEVRVPDARQFGVDLSAGRAHYDGSTYEVFHYPAMWKSRNATFESIYRRQESNAEFAIAFTDFRIDDIHNHGSSNAVHEGDTWHGAPSLLSATGPVFLGPRFRETIVTPERTYKNHAFGVSWMAHEMIHLWGISVQFPHPIASPDHHWSDWFETKVVAPVAPLFADPPYHEGSIMGGMEIYPAGDGKFHGDSSHGAVSGLSALDLWLMGLIDEAPPGHEETRLIVNNEFVPIRFSDVVKANQRLARAPRDFRQAVFVLHENGRAVRPEALAQANSLERMVLRYYDAATQGRMLVRPAE